MNHEIERLNENKLQWENDIKMYKEFLKRKVKLLKVNMVLRNIYLWLKIE